MNRRSLMSILVFVSVTLCMFSCSAIKEGIASSRNPKGFVSYNANIQIESKNDEQFAGEIQKIYPKLIDSIENKLNSKFKSTPVVFICSTNESFCKCTGAKFPGPRAKVTAQGIFISPRLHGSIDWFDIFYHELVHSIMFQKLGSHSYYTIPIWFHEGLATFVSNGGGSGNITDSIAINEILKGNHFYPHASFIRSYLSKPKLAPWIEYRQYMLFVKFLNNNSKPEFDKLIQSILEKKHFSKSITDAYGKNIHTLWSLFLENLKAL
ncbi:MAG: hypothetical protein JXR53_00930 [Bacteroidales bacterium]|nr:hypothetical protein [Bacteroidales bacterium]